MIPDTHHDLLTDEKRALAYLATLMPDGSPQLTPVWFDYQDGKLRVNTARGRVKEKNMNARPQVALVVHDPDDSYRYMQFRGEVVGSTEEGAEQHINRLSEKYRGKPYPALAPGEVRVIFEIEPRSASVGL